MRQIEIATYPGTEPKYQTFNTPVEVSLELLEAAEHRSVAVKVWESERGPVFSLWHNEGTESTLLGQVSPDGHFAPCGGQQDA